MTAPATSPLSYNAYIQNIGVMAVATTSEVSGVWQFNDATFQTIVGQMLNYAELRISRDVDALQARSSNTYTLTQGNNTLAIPLNDFVTVETLEILQKSGSTVVNSCPLTPVSAELIQNCYSGITQSSTPRFFAMVGSTFADGNDTSINVLLGPPPNYAYPVRVRGVVRMPSLATYATTGVADTSYTYISQWLPDLLIMASMVYVSAFQRQFSATSDDPAMGQTYEKQYQALLPSAIAEENRKKQMGSAWSAYSSPGAATPTR